MRTIIQFTISKGEKQYVASCVDVPIVTQGKTLDDLSKNIKEAVELHFEGESFKRYDLKKRPSVLLNFELPVYA